MRAAPRPAPGAQGDALRDHFVDLLLANLDPADVAFLTRIAILDHLHADLCAALARVRQCRASAWRAWRATRRSSSLAEGSEWLRMHSLARDVLRERFATAEPAASVRPLHGRAADWLAAHGQLVDAAGHALAAGQTDRAYELAERSLYESLMTHGHLGSVLEWLDAPAARGSGPPAAAAAGGGLVAGA